MTVASVHALFSELRAELVPIVQAIAAQPLADDASLRQAFPEAQQLAFGLVPTRAYGYDFDRGRIDKTHHPFCTKFASGDVRITTRVRENDLGDALFTTLHEPAHARFPSRVWIRARPHAARSGTSTGVHESQSRLWENIVGRSRGFWRIFTPAPQNFSARARRCAARCLPPRHQQSRTLAHPRERSKVTYNLHVILRFDLELKMLEGPLKLTTCPTRGANPSADFGIAPPDDRDGCLQDVHWYAGTVGSTAEVRPRQRPECAVLRRRA